MKPSKSAPKAPRLSEIEGAIHLRMSPSLLAHFTKHAVKYQEDVKLRCVEDEGGRWYTTKDLDAFDNYLRAPWPKSPKAQRPKLPDKIRKEIMLEAAAVCPICGFESAGEAAHIEAVSASKSHHPENLLWLCPNHHTVIDDVAQMSNVKIPVAQAVKELLVERKLRLLRHEFALDKSILDLIRLVEKASDMLANAGLKDAHGGIEAVAAIDLKGLSKAAKAASRAKISKTDADAVSLQAFAKKISTSTAKASVKKPSSLVSWKEEAEQARSEYLKATGKVDCPLCHGSGHHDSIDCPVCQGEGSIREEDEEKVDLADFEMVDCPVCDGAGTLRGDLCPGCGGDARMERRFAGSIDVSAYGLVDCPVCDGSGSRDGDQCPFCRGERQIESRHAADIDLADYDDVKCRLCNGSGQYEGFDCPACAGECRIPKGMSDRIDWSDFDLVKCPECKGTGASEYGGDCRFCGGHRKVFRRDADAR
ncbi:zinc finger domain-containing protein [Ancylobacter defluvii]|uniref:HNH nuclease domain-containing protein n=1 Tax=Ancylobacter defluvii TaxID=1282440 RepID=A0A9W6JWY9_9HYPH|nr:HNH endonuclease signature motif containing protein [Ancylobacter defluvii]MBS7589795.1 hypothetical protein [Ancylobacter defluvii]GLK82913.1 hypothetical protein GCM10017653_09820 [Ancylobacter defluvii]